MTTTETVTAIIAGYGAVLSTVAIVTQIANDRVKLKLVVSWNMKIVGDPDYEGMTLIVLKVTNTGHRPVTITHIGAWLLYPENPFIMTDTHPPLSHTIKEGEFITSIMNQASTDCATIDYWNVIDSTGRVYKLRETSWVRHFKSAIQWKLAKRRGENAWR
jgi:hypothetical protein